MSPWTGDVTEAWGRAAREDAVGAYLEAVQGRRRLPLDDARRLRDGFVDHARAYGDAHGIEYETWLEFGVPGRVLRAAGINPAS